MKKCLTALAVTVLCLAGSARAETPQFSKHIQPFLKTYCVECHNSKKAKARVNLESYAAMMSAARRGQKMVVPGEPDKSRLLHTLEGKAKQMPPRKYAHQPTTKEVGLLREWIAAGAKTDKEKDATPAEKAAPQAQDSSGPQRDYGRARATPFRNVNWSARYRRAQLTAWALGR